MRRHDADDLLADAVSVTLRSGLGALTFGAVAREAGVPDRTVVYYFPTKDALVAAVLDALQAGFTTQLDAVLGEGTLPPGALAAAVWGAVSDPAAEPAMTVLLEVCVRAARGGEAERDAAQRIARSWLAWLTARLQAGPGEDRDRIAAALLARLDGALLLRAVGLPEIAARALAG